MKSSKVLNNLFCDIISLANNNNRIASDIIVIANEFINEFSTWLNKPSTKKALQNIPDVSVIEAIKWMDKVKQNYPSAMSKPKVYQELLNDPSGAKYTPYLYYMNEILKNYGSQILEKYSDILYAAENFKDIPQIDIEGIKNSLNFIEHEYRTYLETFINNPFGDDKESPSKKTRMTKNEKMKSLFHFLCEEAGKEIASALDEIGYSNIANNIKSDPMFLVDYNAIKNNNLVVGKSSYHYMMPKAQDVAKTILKRLDPSDYEYNYNLLINNAMKFNMAMSHKEYMEFFHNLMLQKGRGVEKIERVNFPTQEWINPNVISFLFLTLNIMMRKINF